MALTYTRAVELLEKYGIKVSVQCNGLPVIKACAEVIQGLEGALETAQTLTSGPMPFKIVTEPAEKLQKQTSLLKTLRIPVKKLEDGDILFIKTNGDFERGYEIVTKIRTAIQAVTKKNVLVWMGIGQSDMKHLDLKGKLKLLTLAFKPLTHEARVKLLLDLTAEVSKL